MDKMDSGTPPYLDGILFEDSVLNTLTFENSNIFDLISPLQYTVLTF